MKIWIGKTKEIDDIILSKIKALSPRNGLKQDLSTDDKDIWVKTARENYAGYIQDREEIVCFWVLTQDKKFNMSIATSIGIKDNTTATIIYLFTNPKYKKQWHAKELIDSLFQYAKNNFPLFEQLIWSTSTEYNKNLYLKYGAQLNNIIKKNNFMKKEKIDQDFIFSYIP